jgi:5-methyltetrahydrofolate--homocysteine methyltransferase
MATSLTSKNGTLVFGPGLPTVLINDKLVIMDQSPVVLDELRSGKIDFLLEMARMGQRMGMDMVDILITHPEVDEVELLPRIAAAVCEEIGCPIALDSRDPEALEAALSELQPYKAVINSVSTENEVMESLLPLAVKYKAAIIGMPMGQGTSVPETVEERLAETRTLIETAEGYGVPREDIIMDGIVLASSAQPDTMMVTLQTLRAMQEEYGVATVLGIGNAGHGMPTPVWIDLAYLLAAIPWGLNMALVDPQTPGIMKSVLAADFLVNNDEYGKKYIADYRETKRKAKNK